jgi:DNA polymerase III delta prime subunit
MTAQEDRIEKLAVTGAHAVLFYGSKRSELDARAKSLIAAWMCPKAIDGVPCGACQTCRQLDTGGAMDLLSIRPGGPSHLIRIDAITDTPGSSAEQAPLTEFVQRAPLVSAHKVVAIYQVERLNSAAANALLKNLEEPQPRVKLVLTSESIGSVMGTIVSRCVCLPCASPAADTASGFAAGLELTPEELAHESYQALLRFLDHIPSLPRTAALGAADQFRKLADGFDAKAMGGARSIHAELVRCLATWVAYTYPEDQELRQSLCDAHRRILGNGSFAVQIDPIFCELLKKNRVVERK